MGRRQFLAGSVATASTVMLPFALPLAGCGRRQAGGSLSIPPPGPDVAGSASLKEHAADAKLLFGFAVDPRQLRDNHAYRAVVEQQCSIVVAENAMKWHALRPAIDRYAFDEADSLLSFAEKSRIKLRGHTLCWHEALPPWFSAEVNAGNARTLLLDHIRTVAGRYAGRMHSWDVVNEAVEVRDGRADGLRNSPWLRLVGTDYIEVAFRTARVADPSALLSYNDYGLEPETQQAAEKRTAVLLMLRRLKQRNVPIDAVGIQSHLQARPTYGYGAGLQKFIASCREMGLEVLLSEMDVSDRDLPAGKDVRDLEVAERYGSYLNTALEARNVTTLITWGVGDGGTWLNAGEARRDNEMQRPLLFDSHFQPKPAFAAVRRAFDHRLAAPSAQGIETRRPVARPVLPRL